VILPEKISAGLTFSQFVTLTAYHPTDWALSAVLRGPIAINLTATAEGAQHKFSASAETTGSWPPGVYWYSVRASDGVETVEVETGQLTIAPDLAIAGNNYDGRTHAQITLQAIEAVIEKRATLDQERYRINNRELYRTPIADLLKLRDYYRAQVRQEQAATRGKNLFGGTVRVRLR
jgi:hypothetical protein